MDARWLNEYTDDPTDGCFDVCVPLSMLLGFAEDYRKLGVNCKHELILGRANIDTDGVVQTTAENVKISLRKIEWLIPHAEISDKRKIQLLDYIAKDPPIAASFRAWELYEYPLLPTTTKHVWAVKTSTQLEEPRHVILGFQTGRKNASHSDYCNLRDVKVFLNSQSYPYANTNFDVAHGQYAMLHDMYANFKASHYCKEPEPLLARAQFLKNALLIVIDYSKQNESTKSGPLDIRL